MIDTSNLWSHDKELPESKVPILGISAYNHLRKLQGKKAVDLAEDQFLVNANYKGTAKQISNMVVPFHSLLAMSDGSICSISLQAFLSL